MKDLPTDATTFEALFKRCAELRKRGDKIAQELDDLAKKVEAAPHAEAADSQSHPGSQMPHR